jgi:hypothetical protein
MRQSDLEGLGALRHALPTTYVSPMNMAPNITAIAMAGKNEPPWWLPAVKSEPAKTARTSVGKIERSITTKTPAAAKGGACEELTRRPAPDGRVPKFGREA